MRSLPQPVIAAVNGDAYGGGMCLTLGAELRFAAEGAAFNATGIVNGLSSTEMGASWLLPRLIGAAHSNDLLLTGRVIDADEALPHGAGVPGRCPPTSCCRAAIETAGRMARYSAYGLAMTKSTIWANLEIASLAGRPGARGPQPADDGLHRQPARGDAGLRRGPRPDLHRRAPPRPLHAAHRGRLRLGRARGTTTDGGASDGDEDGGAGGDAEADDLREVQALPRGWDWARRIVDAG